MSWKQLKTLAIAILVLMNGIFLFLISQRNHSASYYDEDLIDSALEVFHQSEMYVDRAFLSEKKPTFPVYSGVVPTGANMRSLSVVKTIEKAGFSLLEESGGVRLTGKTAEFYFADDFEFHFFERGAYERPSDLLRSGRYVSLSEEDDAYEKALSASMAFFTQYGFLSDEAERLGYGIELREVFFSGSEQIVTFSQTIQGVLIHEEITLLVLGGKVAAADGVFASVMPASEESAELCDPLALLFLEKAYLDDRFRAEGGFAYTPMVLKALRYSYAVYFDAEGAFYLVPICEISYHGGESRTYNCVSGQLYS